MKVKDRYDEMIEMILDGRVKDRQDAIEWNRMPTISELRSKVKPSQLATLRRQADANMENYPEVAGLEISVMAGLAKKPTQFKWLASRWKQTDNKIVKSYLAWSILEAADRDQSIRNEALEYLRGI